jgi:L-amino acid N-acyltransferase YncA
MEITSRPATVADLGILLDLYSAAVAEQHDIKPVWTIADALPEPPDAAFRAILSDEESLLVVGELDGVALGFAWARSEPLLPQAGERVAVVRLIFTLMAARGVGIGDAMIREVLGHFRASGHRRFDARVSPGHRHAKNFFESNGFAARLIVMHHLDEDDD